MSNNSLAAKNKAALDYFVQTPVTRHMVKHLAQVAASVIRCEEAIHVPNTSQLPPTPPATPPPTGAPQTANEPPLPPLEAFITSIVEQSHVQIPTLMPTLVYLARLQKRLPPVAKGIRCTAHRIFLASLILSAKNLNDSSPKNKHWARYTSVPGYPSFGFSTSEVNLMEMQLLHLLDWDLRITTEDLYLHLEPFLAPIRVKQQEKADRKLQAMLRERELAHQQQQQQQQQLQEYQQRQRSQYFNVPGCDARNMYDSPRSLSSLNTSEASSNFPRIRYFDTSRSSSRAPSRTPSLSPPSRCDSRTDGSSYAGSIQSGSPASVVGSSQYAYANAGYDGHVQAKIHDASNEYHYSRLAEPEVVHIQPTQGEMPKPATELPMIPPPSIWYYHPQVVTTDEKPAKKLKTSTGNIFSRFLGGSANVPTNPTTTIY